MLGLCADGSGGVERVEEKANNKYNKLRYGIYSYKIYKV